MNKSLNVQCVAASGKSPALSAAGRCASVVVDSGMRETAMMASQSGRISNDSATSSLPTV